MEIEDQDVRSAFERLKRSQALRLEQYDPALTTEPPPVVLPDEDLLTQAANEVAEKRAFVESPQGRFFAASTSASRSCRVLWMELDQAISAQSRSFLGELPNISARLKAAREAYGKLGELLAAAEAAVTAEYEKGSKP